MCNFPLQVELREDLVGSCVVGDVITVLGLVKVLATGDPKPAGAACWCMVASISGPCLCVCCTLVGAVSEMEQAYTHVVGTTSCGAHHKGEVAPTAAAI